MGSLSLRPPLLIAAFMAVAILSGAVSGAVVALLAADDDSRSTGAVAQATPARNPSSEMSIEEVAARAIPAVVTVLNEGETRTNESGLAVETVSSGSGVIIDEAGFVVTNEHVVHEPGTLSVVLENGEQRPAVIVSHDAPFTDLAVLQIPEGGLEALSLGDSDELELGQTVIAIGSALFEYRNSVSTGIISGLDRRYLREGVYLEDLIQTDAAINTGNSGGPLVTLDGRMVGLVSNVVRRIEGADTVHGISFAISSRTMAPILESILRDGSFPRPYFGIEHLDLDVPTAAEMGLPISSGALVQDVFDGSPAAAAGIQPGDIITAMGPAEINESFTFLSALAIVGPSDRTPVEVVRNNEAMQLTVQLVPRE
jgi:2-alkenal reductase